MAVRTLLVGMDSSPVSDRTLRRAVLLARQTGASLELVHVVATDGKSDADADASAGVMRASLDELCVTLAEVDGIEAHARVETGVVHEALLAAADVVVADLLVVGAPHRAGIGSGLPTGTVERLVRANGVPLLIVASVPTGLYESIVLATDFAAPSQAALQAVARLGLDQIGELAVAHVFETTLPALRETEQVSIRGQAEAWVAAERARYERELDAFLAGTSVVVRQRVLEPDVSTPIATLLAVIRALAGDVVVLGGSERSRLGRHLSGTMLAGLVRAGLVDVLVVPAPGSAA